jgi:hypothetical protein
MRSNQRTFGRLVTSVLACALVTLAACSANAPGIGPFFKPVFTHQQLAPLTIPHVTRLAAFSRLAPSSDPDLIDSVSTFLPAGQTNPRVLLTVDGAGYITRLDGGGASAINLPYPRYSPGISPFGSWLACANETDQSYDHPEIQVASISSGAAIDKFVAQLAAGGYYLYPTWSPDGTRLAVLHDQEDSTSWGCAIGLYSSAPPYHHFKHLTEVTNLDHFVYGFDENGFSTCSIDGLAWSPDGTWLAVLTQDELFLVPTTALLNGTITSSGATTLDLPDVDLVPVASVSSDGRPSIFPGYFPTWDPHTGFLTYLAVFDGPTLEEEIVTYDPTHAKQQVELRLPLVSSSTIAAYHPDTLEHISAVAWTPDGQQMLLVLDQNVGCVDCALTYPSEVYLYTPSP